MKMMTVSLAMIVMALSAPAMAQPSASPSGGQAPDVRGQALDRGRPTKVSDEMPRLDFNAYFAGQWSFEWDMPDSIIGPGGTLTGTVTYKHLDGPFYEAVTAGKGPSGTFSIKELIAYNEEAKTLTRWITDSRGVAYLQTGSVGGDLGGTYQLYLNSAPVVLNGKTVRFRNAVHLMSPGRYRNQLSTSVDGGPFVTAGNPWFERVPSTR